MRIADHLGKLSWTLGDKALYLLYGFAVRLWQISLLPKEEFGLYGHLEVWHSLIFTITDGLALMAIVKFGVDKQQQGHVNRMAGILHIATCLGAASIISAVFLFIPAIPQFFEEPRLADVALLIPIYTIVNIPRTFCIKLLLRDLQMRDLFVLNLVWFAIMASTTLVIELTKGLRSFEDLAFVHIFGAALSSVHAIWLTRDKLQFSSPIKSDFRAILRFGANQAGSVGMYSTGNMLDQLIIQKFFGTVGVAAYTTARTFFRAFDALRDGLVGVFYPALVKLLAKGDQSVVQRFISKATSFYILINVSLFTVLQLGLADWIIIGLLPEEYKDAALLFKVLLIVALIHPFSVSISYIQAQGRTDRLLHFTIVAIIISLPASWLVGVSQLSYLMPLPLILNNIIIIGLSFLYLRKYVAVGPTDLFRAIPDSLDYGRKLLKR